VLKIGKAVLFESAVICEYLDEVHPPPLHPADPLRKAVNRAWIEFSSELFVDLYRLALAKDQEGFEENRQAAREKLERLEADQLEMDPFFNGREFSLVDAAIAPAFLRMALLDEVRPLGLLVDLPKVRSWSASLLERESIRTSVVPEFPDLFRQYLAASSGYLGSRLS
jgi:glutathione S-transferase